ncbi:hypothetical protein FLLO111716_02825 [Flavobacterium longum]|uniref:hypothetical protein n=1 Tax=Flavobacterium longum TaxID=1299340 RepID=UPI0039E93126
MEREKSNYLRDHDKDDAPVWANSDSAERDITSRHKDDTYLGSNKDVSGNDKTEEERDRVRRHEAHGNRRYESFSNHSSADDQPATDTGA